MGLGPLLFRLFLLGLLGFLVRAHLTFGHWASPFFLVPEQALPGTHFVLPQWYLREAVLLLLAILSIFFTPKIIHAEIGRASCRERG